MLRPTFCRLSKNKLMNFRTFENRILTPLDRWLSLGEKKDVYGTSYIGHIFKESPFGFLHVVYKGASLDAIIRAEEEIGRSFPKQFKEFLQFSNGASFYNPSGLNIYGVLLSEYYPEFETNPWRFPTDIVAGNNYDWLSQFPNTAVVLGKDEGVGSYLISIHSDGPVVEFDINDPYNIANQWDDFDDWITSELDNLFIEHDDNGFLLEIGGGIH